MKILFTGGQKSGKSLLAEQKTKELASQKPFYLATSEVMDDNFAKRVAAHKVQRGDDFVTIEEPLSLVDVITKSVTDVVLIDCLTLWINNMLYHNSEEKLFKELEALLTLPNDIVMVLNDVGSGIIPINKLAREFVDISGKVSQMVAAACDEVYYCNCGLSLKMK